MLETVLFIFFDHVVKCQKLFPFAPIVCLIYFSLENNHGKNSIPIPTPNAPKNQCNITLVKIWSD